MQFGTGAGIKKIDIDDNFIHVEFEGGGHTTIPGSEFRLIARAVEARGAGNIAKLNHVEEAVGDMLLETLLQGFRGRAEKLEAENKKLKSSIETMEETFQSAQKIISEKTAKISAQAILLGEKSLEISQLKKQIEKLMTGVDVKA